MRGGAATAAWPKRSGRYDVALPTGSDTLVERRVAHARGEVAGARVVELTRLRHEAGREADVRAAFLSQARAASRVRHAAFVHPEEALIDAGDLVVATAWVDGLRLDRLRALALARGAELPPRIALRVARDVVAAVAALHDAAPRSCPHGDVAPTNVLVDYAGRSRLVHSGVALAACRPGAGVAHERLAYKAPEQVVGAMFDAPLDPAVDVFACGVLVWEALAGRSLFGADSESAVAHAVCTAEVPGLPVERSSAAVCEAVAAALARLRAERPARVTRLLAALDALDEEHVASQADVAAFVDEVAGEALEAQRAAVHESLEALADAAAGGAELDLLDLDDVVSTLSDDDVLGDDETIEARALTADDEVEAHALTADDEVEAQALTADDEVEAQALTADDEVEAQALTADDEVEVQALGAEDEVEAQALTIEDDAGEAQALGDDDLIVPASDDEPARLARPTLRLAAASVAPPVPAPIRSSLLPPGPVAWTNPAPAARAARRLRVPPAFSATLAVAFVGFAALAARSVGVRGPLVDRGPRASAAGRATQAPTIVRAPPTLQAASAPAASASAAPSASARVPPPSVAR